MTDHLTDSELQDIAGGTTADIDAARQAHLTTCAACSRRLIFFQALIVNLDDKEEISIPANFADDVMSAVTALKACGDILINIMPFLRKRKSTGIRCTSQKRIILISR